MFITGPKDHRKTKMKRNTSFALITIAAACLFVSHASARRAEENYHDTLVFAGYYARGAIVCNDMHFANVSVAAATSPDLVQLSNAFPEKYNLWFDEGARYFNDTAMDYGLSKTCINARKKLK
jgi:hypothetical protein